VATAPNPPIAHIWEQALAQAGIRSTVVGDYLDAGLGDITGMQPEVWVHRDDLEKAREVLRQHHSKETEQAAARSETERRSES
jgi:hypothetical protein